MKKNEQEEFWSGAFGDQYIDRNKGESLLASNVYFFSNSLKKIEAIDNVIEFGANIGMNLKALNIILPKTEKFAVEINKKAALELSKTISAENIFNCSIAEFESTKQFDLCLIKGVLIHIAPDSLQDTYKKLVKHTRKFLLIAEYYNPEPVEIKYRDYSNKLFKRDFAGEIMANHPEMKLIDYGFSYRNDPKFPQDDITWFLFEKK